MRNAISTDTFQLIRDPVFKGICLFKIYHHNIVILVPISSLELFSKCVYTAQRW